MIIMNVPTFKEPILYDQRQWSYQQYQQSPEILLAI